MLLLLTTILVDVINNMSYGDPLNSYSYYRKPLRNYQYNRRNDYNFKDWEETSADYYEILFSTTNSSHITPVPRNITFPSILTEETSPFTTIQTTTTTPFTSTFTSPTSIVTDTSTTTVLTSPEPTTTAVTIDVTSELPEVASDYIFETNFTIVPSTNKPIDNHMVNEIKKIKLENREGSFTASLMLLLKIAKAKSSEQLNLLIDGLNSEVMRLNSHNQFRLFGSLVSERITSAAVAAAASDVEVVRAQIEFTYNSLKRRRGGGLYHEINAIFDVTDNIYNEDDVINVADAIRDLLNFPNIDKKSDILAKDIIDAFLFKPFRRIQGTTKERLLLMEIDNAMEKLRKLELYGRRNFDSRYLQTNETTKTIMDYIIESKYVKNNTAMKRMKHRMMKYKHKRQKDKRKRVSRGLTTTTVIVTTTTRPKMRKSKYYIRKYVKKDLPKRTTTTKKPTTTKDKFKYYGKIRKKKIVGVRRSVGRSSGGDYEGSDVEDYYSDEDAVPSDTDRREQTDLYTFKYKYNKNLDSKYSKNLDFNESNEEFKLKLKLQDALIHTEYNNGRRHFNEGLYVRDIKHRI